MARCTVDDHAPVGLARRHARQGRAYHGARYEGALPARSGQSAVQGRAPQPAPGCRTSPTSRPGRVGSMWPSSSTFRALHRGLAGQPPMQTGLRARRARAGPCDRQPGTRPLAHPPLGLRPQYVSIRYSERRPKPASSPRSAVRATVTTMPWLRPSTALQGRADPPPYTLEDVEAVELATLEWVSWFNHHRLLEPIGYIPPAEAEATTTVNFPSRPSRPDSQPWPPQYPGGSHQARAMSQREGIDGPDQAPGRVVVALPQRRAAGRRGGYAPARPV